MKKRIGALLITGAMLLTASCAKIEINVNEAASRIANEGSFAEELTEVPADITLKRFNIDSSAVAECAAYAGTRAVVDEVAVFKTNDAEVVKVKIEEHLANQTESYTSYRPDELPKLDDALVEEIGDYIILCVDDADTAKKIVEEYTK